MNPVQPAMGTIEVPQIMQDSGEPAALEGLWVKDLFSLTERLARREALQPPPRRAAPPFPGSTIGSVLIVKADRQRCWEDARRLGAVREREGAAEWLLSTLGRLAGAPSRLRPGPCDLLLFDGGRFNYRICPPSEARWALGGFAGWDPAGRLWVWS